MLVCVELASVQICLGHNFCIYEFQNNLAQLFSLRSRNAIWNIFPCRLKVKDTLKVQMIKRVLNWDCLGHYFYIYFMTYLRRNNKRQITSLFYPFTPLYNICQIVAVMVSSEKVRQRCLLASINPGSANKPRGEQACEIRIYIHKGNQPPLSARSTQHLTGTH